MKTLSPKDTRVLGYWSVVTTLVLFTILLFVGGELHWMLLPFACYGMLGVAFIAESSDGEFATANRALYRILALGAGVPPIVIILSGWYTEGLDLQRIGNGVAVAAILVGVSVLTFAFYIRRHGVDEGSERRDHATDEDR